MMHTTLARPDVTLTLDDEGIILQAVPAEALAEEHLEVWSGRRFAETVNSDVDQSILHSIQNLRENGASTCFQVKQRFPSGREVPMDYTAISLGDNAGFVAVGRNLQVVSDLESRLQLAQQAREQDYWRIREIETRYRMLFDATNEAVVLVAVNDLRIIEANLTAEQNLGLFPGGDFRARMQERDKKGFRAMLEKVREQGRAPSIVVASFDDCRVLQRARLDEQHGRRTSLFAANRLHGRHGDRRGARRAARDVERRPALAAWIRLYRSQGGGLARERSVSRSGAASFGSRRARKKSEALDERSRRRHIGSC